MKNRFQEKAVVAVAAGLGSLALLTGSARANLTLTLSEPGFGPATIVDTGNTGVVSSFAPYGTYNLIDVSVGTSNKLQSPTPAEAELQITSIVESNVSNSTTPLTITVTDNGFAFPGLLGTNEFMDSSLGGTMAPSSAGDGVTFMSTATATSGVGATNVSSGLQSYTSPGFPIGNGSFTVPDANKTFIRGTSFDLTSQIVVTLTKPFEQANVSGTTTVVPVPEPTTAAVSMGLIGLLSMRRRRTAVQA